MRELIGMKNAKLIDIEEVKDVEFIKPKEIKIVLEEPKEAKEIVAPKVVKEVKEGKDGDKPQKTIKKISRKTDPEVENTDDEVVIMFDGKAKKGKSKRSMTGEIEESDATKASIEALKQIEAEEEADAEAELNRKEIDESALPLNERMGEKVTIAYGSKSTSSVKMKNSILPEAEQIKNSNKFIQSEDEKAIKQKEKERIKNAFIDNRSDENNENNEIDDGDDLIET